MVRGWMVGGLVLWGATALSLELPARIPADDASMISISPALNARATLRPPTKDELATLLAQREAELKEVKLKLAALDDAKWYAEAQSLGVSNLMAKYGFTEKQTRKLSVAIVREAQANGLDPLLVVAVIHCESSFNPYALSGPGAMGLMQVMPDTGAWLANQRGYSLRKATNLYDGELNIELGTAYLASLIQEFGSVEHALVAYNAGPRAAKKILANRKIRRKFIAGYPMKVVGEYRKLKAQVAQQMAAVAEKSVAKAD